LRQPYPIGGIRYAIPPYGLPTVPGFDRWLYVFRGAVSVGDQQAETHTALTIGAGETGLDVTAIREADLVLFLVGRQAAFSRAGTMSG
jgi:redox-sensitive bicupin YhaK (pirin superfamily)